MSIRYVTAIGAAVLLSEAVLFALPVWLKHAPQDMLHTIMGIFIVTVLFFLLASLGLVAAILVKSIHLVIGYGKFEWSDVVVSCLAILLWLPALSTFEYFSV